MIDIVVFGKPRSYESYEFEFEGQQLPNPINTHTEPVVKHPVIPWGPIYHYYRRDGIAGLELYTPCEGFDSNRMGIIFGVGLKSNHDFGLTEVLELLGHYWEDLASAFIDNNNKFVSESIIDSLRETEWSDEEIAEIRNIVKPGIIANTRLKKELLLLVANDTSDIDGVETSIKKYADVYIANDKNLFKDSINRTAFEKQANSQIYTVTDGKIFRIEDGSTRDNNRRRRKTLPGFDKKPVTELTNNSNGDLNKIPDEDTSKNSSGQSNVGNDTTSDGSENEKERKRRERWKRRSTAAIVFIVIIVGLWFFIKPKPADRIDLAQPENGYIKDSFNFQPELYHDESKRTSTELKDIVWEKEGGGAQFIDIESNGKWTCLKINRYYYQNKPRQETQVTIIASVDGKELGKQTYKIEEYQRQKANKITMVDYPSPIATSQDITPTLSFNGDTDVTTKLSEVKFDITPSGYARVENNKGRIILAVNSNRQNSEDVTVMVTAKFDGGEGSQSYKISANNLNIDNENNSQELSGSIYYRRAGIEHEIIGTETFSMDDIGVVKFVAKDANGSEITGGKWGYNEGNVIYIAPQTSSNVEIRISEIKKAGRVTLFYKKNGQVVAQTKFNVVN